MTPVVAEAAGMYVDIVGCKLDFQLLQCRSVIVYRAALCDWLVLLRLLLCVFLRSVFLSTRLSGRFLLGFFCLDGLGALRFVKVLLSFRLLFCLFLPFLFLVLLIPHVGIEVLSEFLQIRFIPVVGLLVDRVPKRQNS